MGEDPPVSRLSDAATIISVWAVVVTSSLVWMPGIDVARAAALLVAAGAVAVAPARGDVRRLASDRAFLAVLAVGLLIVGLLLVADLLRSERGFGQGDDVRLIRLLTVFIVGRALFAVSRPASGARWIGWLVSVTVLGVLGVLFAMAGINPATVLADTVSEGRFRPMLNAFRIIHEQVNERAGTATLRHFEVRAMVVGALMGMMLLTRAARRSTVVLAVSSFVVASGMAFVTVSRGNMIAVVITVLPAFGWALRRVSNVWRMVVVVAVVGIGLASLQIDAVSDALGDGSTNSSEVRSARLDLSIDLLDDAAVRGVPKVLPDGTFVASPHNMVLDLWLGGGVVAGLGGAVLLAIAVRKAATAARRVFRSESFEAVVMWTGVFGLLAVVVVRMMTGGGGLMDAATWFGLGAALALCHTR